jgi:hypothetical protein
MEYDFYSFYNLNQSLNGKATVKDSISKLLNRFIPKSTYDILDYVNSTRTEKSGLYIGGLDIWVRYRNKLGSIFHFLPKNNFKYNSDSNLIAIYNGILKKNNLAQELEYLDNKTKHKLFFKSDSLNLLWLQIYNNFLVEKYYNDFFTGLSKSEKKKFRNKYTNQSSFDDSRRRDSMMFQNFEYLKEQYKGEKIIIYTSTFHMRRSVEPFIDIEDIGNNTKPLGQYISEKYDSNYYIAWIYNKVEKNNGERKKNKSFYKRSKKSIEYFLNNNNFGSCIIDIHKLSENGDSIFTMYPIWSFKTTGKWSDALDAVIYSDTALSIENYYDYGNYIDTSFRKYYNSSTM